MESMHQFAQVRKDLVETVSSFPLDKLDELVCGEWDIKSVLAHITGWDIHFTTMVSMLKSGKDAPHRGDDVHKWNQTLVLEREGNSWNEAQATLVEAGAAFMDEYADLEQDLWNRRFWEGRNPTPAWVLKHNAEHYEEHLEEILTKLREWER